MTHHVTLRHVITWFRDSWCYETIGTKELLVPRNCWYQGTVGTKELLVPRNCWYQGTVGTIRL
jgi:hypothetical protein